MSEEEIKDDYRYKAEQLAEMYFDAYAKAPNAKRRTALSRSYQEAMRTLADYTVIRLKLARGESL